MKHFLKVFFIAALCFGLAIVGAVYSFNKFYDPVIGADVEDKDVEDGSKLKDILEKEDKNLTPLEKAIKKSDRVNVLLLGVEHQNLSDTMIFASFDPETKKLDMMSIPRDTYFHESGYDDGGNRKLNAKHARSGPTGVKRAVEDILGVPIDYYVSVKYEGVKDIVDTLGGVEMDVPFNMKYQDPTDNPPLYINIPKGKQILNGEKAIQFLRYRKSNDGKQGYRDGDLGRVKAQQEFLKSAAKKALGFKLPWVINKGFKNIRTDMELGEMLDFVPYVKGFNVENIDAITLPGSARYKKVNGQSLSFFLHDPEKVEEFMYELYEVDEEE